MEGNRAKAYVRPLKLRTVTLPNNLIFAPMAGYSDASFRQIVRELGAGLTVTEMVSAKGLIYKSEHTGDLLKTGPSEQPSAVQLFGEDPDVFRRVLEEGVVAKFDLVDINMGCPVPKVVRNGEGSALMQNPERAEKIVQTCRRFTRQVVTVKCRTGFDHQTGVEFAKRMEDAGAELLTVHGRTRAQYYSGKADRGYLAKMVQAVRIPVIANGDVDSVESAADLFEKTGSAGIMIGRGALADPGIFARIAGLSPSYDPISLLKRQFENLLQVSEHYAVSNIRKYVPFLLKGKRGASHDRAELNRCQTAEEVLRCLQEFSLRGTPPSSSS